VVFGEAGMQCEIVHTPQPGVQHVGYSGDWLGIQLTVTHDPQPARSLGDQDAAVRQEGKSIRVGQAPQGDDPELRPSYLAAAGSTSAAVKNEGPIQGWRLNGEFLLRSRRGARQGDWLSQAPNDRTKNAESAGG
jgi:hypothetical protein